MQMANISLVYVHIQSRIILNHNEQFKKKTKKKRVLT